MAGWGVGRALYGNFDIVFEPFLTCVCDLYHPTRAVRCTLLSAHCFSDADWRLQSDYARFTSPGFGFYGFRLWMTEFFSDGGIPSDSNVFAASFYVALSNIPGYFWAA